MEGFDKWEKEGDKWEKENRERKGEGEGEKKREGEGEGEGEGEKEGEGERESLGEVVRGLKEDFSCALSDFYEKETKLSYGRVTDLVDNLDNTLR